MKRLMKLLRGCDCGGLCGGLCPEWRGEFLGRSFFAALLMVAGLAALLILSGCASAPPPQVVTRTEVVRVPLPAGLLRCQGEPAVGAITMQSQVADYIVRLHEAWADCHDDVAAIAQIENTPPEK